MTARHLLPVDRVSPRTVPVRVNFRWAAVDFKGQKLREELRSRELSISRLIDHLSNALIYSQFREARKTREEISTEVSYLSRSPAIALSVSKPVPKMRRIVGGLRERLRPTERNCRIRRANRFIRFRFSKFDRRRPVPKSIR